MTHDRCVIVETEGLQPSLHIQSSERSYYRQWRIIPYAHVRIQTSLAMADIYKLLPSVCRLFILLLVLTK